MPKIDLILASSSPYRRELLGRLGVAFRCVSPSIDETPASGEKPFALCLRLARAKAMSVADENPGAIVIGSDQVCDLRGKILGKPHTFEKAVEQLRMMSGERVIFHTAMCVVAPDGTAEESMSDTVVIFRQLGEETIIDYLNREKPFECAGSAKMEKLGIALVKSVTSDDPTSIIGLPLMRLTGMLSRAGLPVLKGLV